LFTNILLREIDREDIEGMNCLLEVTADRDLMKFIIRTYDALFTEQEAERPEGRPVVNLSMTPTDSWRSPASKRSKMTGSSRRWHTNFGRNKPM
jgi:hypothetical protein